MMSKEANIRAILECNFTGFKDEIIDTAVELICDLECESITSPSQHWAKLAENFGEIAMNEIDKARSCEDCISREEVKSEIRRWLGYLDEDMISRINVGIDRLPSITPKARWIPVSEGLPEHNMSVLITVRRYDDEIVVRSGYYYSNGDNSIFHADNGNCWGIDEDGLLAWMPLPQPYKAESEE